MREFPLLERSREMGLIRAGMRQACGGDGAFVLIEGAGGAGKTRLLAAARQEAERDGLQVLHARAGALERRFVWVVVRQLFERCLSAADRTDRNALLDGPAALANGVFDYAHAGDISTPPQEDGGLYRVLHGLYWLCKNLSASAPLMLLIDDAHYSDTASLRFINYLVNRLEGSGVLLVLTNAPDVPGEAQELLLSAGRSPLAGHAVLEPLGREAVCEAITARLGGVPHDDVTEACLLASHGNPSHLTELLDEMRRRGIAPERASADEILSLAPARIAKEVTSCLHQLPPPARALAEAVAVLDADADPRHCAAAAALDNAVALDAVNALREADLLNPGVPYTFRRPVVRQVVYAQMSSDARSRAHLRSAHSLHAAGVDLTTVAEHLCRTEPGCDAWTVRTLRAAAIEAMRRASPMEATRYLRRALADSSTEHDPYILGQLGSAELRARQSSAIEHLREALRRTREPVFRSRLRLELGLALTASGRYDEALTLLAESDGAASDATEPAEQAVRTTAMVVARITPRRRASPLSRLRSAAAVPRAHAAIEALSRGRPAHRVARLATAAITDAAAPYGEDTELTDAAVAAWTLAQCDEAETAERVLRETARKASDTGQMLAAATATGLLGGVLLDTGRLAEAEAGARHLLRQQECCSLTLAYVPLAAAVLTHCLIERDQLQEAEDALHRIGLTGPLPPSALSVPLRIARVRLSIRQDHFEGGLRELSECREQAGQEGWLYPSASAEYLPEAAKALAITTGPRAACKLAADVTDRARAFGAVRPLAAALRTQGEIVGGDEGLEMLESAEQLLAPTPFLLERARVLVALGAALRRQGRRGAARSRLTAGLDMAHGIGASVLEATARSELRVAGVRQVRSGLKQRTPLTPAEERVAHKAAAGLSNREISQALFVTVKTVEWHLSQAYAKLGIAKRAELTQALANEPAPHGESVPRSA
ncbi:ATP-binding protein [Streptomyces heilongjiangensis]|uniref:ATP-binding protein n=1 Tax=Streptomyces heilongjiangensis TaxID=945052 RepID=A0ABW1B0Y2_9ACTN|nr:LuxR family transcriptional regulator [Streptomyces heilongjiangensis]MDC2946543.1 AAA family ATPase [Streptomyces heilongjiangensis]